MSFIDSLILAVIQGITEWLPVSSSGHLSLYHHLFGLEEPFLYSVILHLSSFFVIIVFFRKKIKEILKSLFSKTDSREGKSYLAGVVIGSLPAAAAGIFLRSAILEVFSDMRVISLAWIFTALMLGASRFGKEKTSLVTPRLALIIGCFQALALIPGISRSGATISIALLLGLKRREAAEFSFILVIPALLGAGVMELFKVESFEGTMLFFLGAVVSFVVGMFAIHILMKIIKQGRFSLFALYCLVLGVVTLFI